MNKISTVAFLIVAFVAGCGGGEGGDELFVLANYPEKLAAYSDQLSARAMIRGPEDQVLSAPSDGIFERGGWTFKIESLGNVTEGSTFSVEYRLSGEVGVARSTDMGGLLLAIYTHPIGELEVVDPSADDFDFSADDDSDGMPNIDELIAGIDPLTADTDGDGVADGSDAFPSIVAEWADTDGDGIGDNVDNDIDGDGLTNDVEQLLGTNPNLFDSDADGVGDGDDNCPLNVNDAQADSDGDGIGDICENDTDGDGLSDTDEARYGSNPMVFDTDGDGLGDGADVAVGGDPLDPDTDDDGIYDPNDNCASIHNTDQSDVDRDGDGDVCDDDIDGDGIINIGDNCKYDENFYQENVDGDGYGDACDDDADNDGVANSADNCPLVENDAQSNVDGDGDGVSFDCDMDDEDAGVRRERDGIFVDIVHGSDSNRGTRSAPLASIAAAVDLAVQGGRLVYVNAGTYDVSDLMLPSGVGVFGGFANGDSESSRFATRDVRSSGVTYKTLLSRQDISTTIVMAADDIVVGGFYIENIATEFDSIVPAATVIISSGSPTIDRCTISGNPLARQTAGVRITGGNSTITRSKIYGGGYDGIGSSSLALLADDGKLKATNNILIAGDGRFATGVSFDGAEVLFVNNTVDGSSGNSSAGVSEGISVSAGDPEIINNVVFTGAAPDQYPLVCKSANPGSDARIDHNLFANFSGRASSPIVVACDGMMYSQSSFSFGDASVVSNRRFAGASRSNLVNSSYILIGAGGSSDGVDDAVDSSSSENGGVTDDFNGRARPMAGAYDIGAIEGN